MQTRDFGYSSGSIRQPTTHARKGGNATSLTPRYERYSPPTTVITSVTVHVHAATLCAVYKSRILIAEKILILIYTIFHQLQPCLRKQRHSQNTCRIDLQYRRGIVSFAPSPMHTPTAFTETPQTRVRLGFVCMHAETTPPHRLVRFAE